MAFKDLAALLRPRQWYKNLVIFLPIIFALQLGNILALKMTFFGFVSLCMISSVNYIINDVLDIEKDRMHPEKKSRPLASGKVRIWMALVMGLALLIVGMVLAFWISVYFSYFAVGLLLLAQVYSLWLRNQIFADVILISINFVIRSVSGAFVIVNGTSPYVEVSPWLMIGTFSLALFLAVGKRKSDLLMLSKSAKEHKEVLKDYTVELANSMMSISTSILVVAYIFYVFLSKYHALFLTLPFALYMIFRYLYFADQGSPIARHPELVFKDIKMVIAMLLWVLITFVGLYVF